MGPCLLGIAGDLPAQGFQVRKGLFVAQFFQKLHTDQPAISIALPVQQMDFQQPLAMGFNSRARPETGDTGFDQGRIIMQATHLHNEDALQCRLSAGKTQVQGGKTQLGAQPAAVDDAPGQGIGPSQHLLCPVKIGLGQRLPDQGTGDTYAAFLHHGHGLHLDAAGLAKGFQHRKITLTLGTEAEIGTDADMSRLQPSGQTVLHEFGGWTLGKAAIEGHQIDLLHAQACQHGQPVTQCGDTYRRRCVLLPLPGQLVEVFARMRLEGEHGGGQTGGACVINQGADQGLMAKMHTVKIADGQGTGLARGGRGQGAKDFHRPDYKDIVHRHPDGQGRTGRGMWAQATVGQKATTANMRDQACLTRPVRDASPAPLRAACGQNLIGSSTMSAIACSTPLRSPARVVILISGRGSNMMALVEAIARQQLPVEVAGVVSNRPDAAGLAWAQTRGIACRALDHRQYADRAAFDAALAEAVDALAPPAEQPWVLLAGFMRVLSADFVSRYAGRLVNIHPALLPAHPGLHTHRQALAAGALLHGATVHFVTPAVDVGPIIAQAVVPVLAGDTEASLGERVLAMEHQLFPRVLGWLAEGRVSVTAQGQVLLAGEDQLTERVLLHPLLTGELPQGRAGLPVKGAAA